MTTESISSSSGQRVDTQQVDTQAPIPIPLATGDIPAGISAVDSSISSASDSGKSKYKVKNLPKIKIPDSVADRPPAPAKPRYRPHHPVFWCALSLLGAAVLGGVISFWAWIYAPEKVKSFFGRIFS